MFGAGQPVRIQEKPRPAAKVVTPDQYAQTSTTKPSTSAQVQQAQPKQRQKQLRQQKQPTEKPTTADVMTLLTSLQASIEKMNCNINQINQRVRVLESSKSPQQESKKRKK